MRLITGDECGLLKECIPELGRKIQGKSAALPTFGAMAYVTSGEVAVQRINRQDQQTRQYGIIDMAYLSSSDDSNDDHDIHNFAALRKDGRVEIWEGNKKHKKFGSYQNIATTKNLFTSSSSSSEDDEKTKDNEEIRPLGLGYYPNSNRICTGDMYGNITIVESTGERNIVETYNAYQSTKRGKTISYTPGKFVNKQLATAISFDSYNNRVAVGGRERETTLLDLSTGKTVFKAKNLPPDPQTLLQQPVWPSSILFTDTNNNVMAVGTAYKEIRLYDCRQDTKTRRPISLTPEGLFDYRITALCRGSNEHQLIVGDTAGNMYDLDTRTLGRDPKKKSNKNLGRYVGPAGSIRQIQKHPTLPLVAAVGLDRMLRIYDINKRKQLDCVYLKQRLNCVLFGSDDTWGGDDDDDDDDDRRNKENDDYDIDQDDMVEDYVDSDNDSEKESDNSSDNEDEGGDDDMAAISSDPEVGGGSNDDIVSREDNESSSSDDDEEEKEIVNKSDDSSQVDDDDDDDYSSSSNESQDERSGSSSDDDEEIVIKAPTKKRRRR